MGGYNSGRTGWRRKIERQHGVDIQWMKRKGWLYDGCSGSLRWSCRGKETGSIGYHVSVDAITLLYKHSDHRSDWGSVEAEIKLQYTHCNYGGKRVWMRCPKCWRRCAKVYIAGKLSACRKCCDLAYYSEAETQLDRVMRRARKLQEKLGYKGGNLDEWVFKPKGMHQKTYERHLKVIKQANHFFACEMMRRFNMEL